MRKLRAIATMAALWAGAGAIAGAIHGAVLYALWPPRGVGISFAQFMWTMVQGYGTTLGIGGAAFAITLTLWRRFNSHGQGKWVIWGTLGSTIASVATILARLAAIHVPTSRLFFATATISCIAATVSIGTIAVAERSARRKGYSLLHQQEAHAGLAHAVSDER